MSLSKVNSTFDNYRRDSYSERVCDDLSEVILQFLPLKDKFRFECVSKQFQRTVYQKQYSLNLVDEHLTPKTMNGQNGNFEKLLKKLPNISSLSSECRHNSLTVRKLNDSDIELIIKYCNNLREFRFDLSEISDQMREKFVAKFGPKLISFVAHPNDMEMIAKKSFPYVKEYKFFNGNWNPVSMKQMFDLKSKYLKKLCFRCYFENPSEIQIQMNGFQQLFENNKQLTHLSLMLKESENNIRNLFKHISQLHLLIELEVVNRWTHFDEELLNSLKLLSLNCPKLKSLTLDRIYFYEDDQGIVFLKALKDFKSLRSLSIEFDLQISNQSAIDNFCETLSDLFKSLKNLTHLRLGLILYGSITRPNLLKDIDKSLPNIKNLVMNYLIEPSEEGADTLSRLSKLEVIKIYIPFNNSDHFKFMFENKIRNNCKNIKVINVCPWYRRRQCSIS